MGHIIEAESNANQKSWMQKVHYIKIHLKSKKCVGKLANVFFLYFYILMKFVQLECDLLISLKFSFNAHLIKIKYCNKSECKYCK